MTRRLELLRCRLFQWNHKEVGDIFRRLEVTEATITRLQDREDSEGGVLDEDLVELRGLLSLHHSLLGL